MSNIKNINLEFSCPKRRDTLEESPEGYNCEQCSKQVIDFTNKSQEDIQNIISKASGSVCGVFKRSQLSKKFIKYAAATFIATTSIALESNAQEISFPDSLLNNTEEEIELTGCEFFGSIIETQAEPIGGYEKFFEAIKGELLYPNGLEDNGKVFVQFIVDTVGLMSDFKILKGFNPLAEEESIRVMESLDYPFKPGEQRGIPVKTRMVIPITFERTIKVINKR